MPLYRIGVDVGGTYTDSVLLRVDPSAAVSPNRGVLASFKHPTTPSVSDGIEGAVRRVLQDKKTEVSPNQINSLMIGTTHFMNAVVEGDPRRLSKVAVIRLGAPYTKACPPFSDFPSNLRAIIEGHVAILRGGLQVDGKVINEIDRDELIAESIKIKEKDLKAVTIVGIFSPLDKTDGCSQEERAKAILSQELGPSVHIVCSRHVGQVGFLERESASILNASILGFTRRTISEFQRAMNRLGLSCPLFLTQNDGTLISAEAATRIPIRTFSSGATNSMRGAAYLSGMSVRDSSVSSSRGSIVVVDIGGTTTDVGVLLPSGFPRPAAAFIEVGGVRTNFSMPDVHSIGLGGGSRVRAVSGKDDSGQSITVGPDSVGYRLLTEGIAFGGSTLTATDVVVAEDPSLLIGHTPDVSNNILDGNVARGAKVAIKKQLEDAIDRMKTNPDPATVLLVGGGSIIAPSKLEGVGELIRPPFFSCANAVGACVANVAGELDTIEILQDRDLDEVLEQCKTEAKARAVHAGANPHTVQIVDVQNLPIQYVTNKATRLIVRAVGELDSASVAMTSAVMDDDGDADYDEGEKSEATIQSSETIKVEQYTPHINGEGDWLLSDIDLEWISEGCGILGCGGGGSPYPGYIMARQILRNGGTIRVKSHSSFSDDVMVIRGCFMGAPSVSNERLPAGAEVATAFGKLARFMNIGTPAAVISDEIGGCNGIQPMLLAERLDVPVIDGDLMGRAYPNMWQTLPAVYNVPASLIPCSISDGVGNSIVLSSTSNQTMVETILRGVCTDLGSAAGVSMAPLSAETCRNYGVTNTVSQAWRIGRAVTSRRQNNDFQGIPAAILNLQNGQHLFTGKIFDVKREVRAGFTWGSITIIPLSDTEKEQTADVPPVFHPEDHLFISFQNENIIAELLPTDSNSSKKTLATVPDLITVLDSQSGSSLGTHEYRYGLRVTVLALAGSPLWTTPQGLEKGGPAAFGLDVPFQSVGIYREPRSVIDEYMPNT